MLELQDIVGGYNASRDILDGVSLRLERGESVGIIGLNGSGKSTLGKAAMNMLPRRTGRVLLDGVDVSSLPVSRLAHEGVGFLMQGAPVFDRMTVVENLKFAAGNKWVLEEAAARLAPVFPRFFKEGETDRGTRATLYRRRADKLSGGERHQLALCLALVKRTKLLVLDEPGAGLDPAAAEMMYATLDAVRKTSGVTILLIEQNVDSARKFCGRVLVMRQGRLEDAALDEDTETDPVVIPKRY